VAGQGSTHRKKAELALQTEWGADEAIAEEPQNRVKPKAAPKAALARAKTTTAPRQTAAVIHAAAETGRAAADACNTLDELRAALDHFDACALKRTATQLVFADGAADAKVIIIGEGPGAEEDRTGKPFVGQAGRLLDRMLGSIGLDRSLVRVINVVPWRPPGNRTPTDTEIAQCLPFLQRHIALVNPKLAVLLGATAVKALIGGKEGITRLRGTWKEIEVPGMDEALGALPTYHPAFLLRQAAAKRLAWADLLTLRAAIEEQGLPAKPMP
jgi:uracil-DNA glycosylase family 4